MILTTSITHHAGVFVLSTRSKKWSAIGFYMVSLMLQMLRKIGLKLSSREKKAKERFPSGMYQVDHSHTKPEPDWTTGYNSGFCQLPFSHVDVVFSLRVNDYFYLVYLTALASSHKRWSIISGSGSWTPTSYITRPTSVQAQSLVQVLG